MAFLIACFHRPGAIAPFDPLAVNPSGAFRPPSVEHWFGTDDSGRDVFSRIVFGARDSLTIGVTATLIGLLAGIVLGALAGGSRVRALAPLRTIADRAIEGMFAFPGLLSHSCSSRSAGPESSRF